MFVDWKKHGKTDQGSIDRSMKASSRDAGGQSPWLLPFAALPLASAPPASAHSRDHTHSFFPLMALAS